MGNNTSNAKAVKRNELLLQKLKAKRKADENLFKLLLLGAGESGKSTILKQIVLLHGPGFDMSDRRAIRSRIAYSLVVGAYNILRSCEKLGHPLTDEKAKDYGKMIFDCHAKNDTQSARITDQLADAIVYLNHDPNFKATFLESGKYQLEDTWINFAKKLENYPEWGGKTWLPDDDDILMARVMTAGVVHQKFKVDGSRFEMIDVGGQRAERKKWYALFKGISGIIFVTSLSEYNQTLFEEDTVNRLFESVNLWREHANGKDFVDSALILFLNKFDLFQEKYLVQKIPLYNPFANFDEPPLVEDDDEECSKAILWFRKMFLLQVEPNRRDEVYIHVTTALDKTHMKAVIDACSSFILQRSLQISGLIPNQLNNAF